MTFILWNNQILGDGMSDHMWEATTNHARTCAPGDELYVYRTALGAIYVNSIFNLVGLEMADITYPPEQLNTDQMVSLSSDSLSYLLSVRHQRREVWLSYICCRVQALVQQLTLEAYEHRHKLQLLPQEPDHRLWSSILEASSSSLDHFFSSLDANRGILEATKAATEADPNGDIDELIRPVIEHL